MSSRSYPCVYWIEQELKDCLLSKYETRLTGKVPKMRRTLHSSHSLRRTLPGNFRELHECWLADKMGRWLVNEKGTPRRCEDGMWTGSG